MTRIGIPETVKKGLRLVSLLPFGVCLVFTAFVSSVAMASDTKSPVFNVTPERCVTLRQGQPCFVRARFEWQSAEAMQVCVYGIEGKKLKCWTAVSGGRLVVPQTLPGTTDYVLADADGNELGRASIGVSWVYKKKGSKRRWRLF